MDSGIGGLGGLALSVTWMPLMLRHSGRLQHRKLRHLTQEEAPKGGLFVRDEISLPADALRD
jgi:hypothetical protein